MWMISLCNFPFYEVKDVVHNFKDTYEGEAEEKSEYSTNTDDKIHVGLHSSSKVTLRIEENYFFHKFPFKGAVNK